MTRRTAMFPARSIGEVSVPTTSQSESVSFHARMPTIMTFNVCVQGRPTTKGRLTFTEKPPLYTVFQLDASSDPLYLHRPVRKGKVGFTTKPPSYTTFQFDAIGTMTSKYFLVDNISPSRQDEIAVIFPPLTAVETKDLARTVQKILEQMVSPKKCKPVRADILDVEIVAA